MVSTMAGRQAARPEMTTNVPQSPTCQEGQNDCEPVPHLPTANTLPASRTTIAYTSPFTIRPLTSLAQFTELTIHRDLAGIIIRTISADLQVMS